MYPGYTLIPGTLRVPGTKNQEDEQLLRNKEGWKDSL